jgi:hypothetical protein
MPPTTSRAISPVRSMGRDGDGDGELVEVRVSVSSDEYALRNEYSDRVDGKGDECPKKAE